MARRNEHTIKLAAFFCLVVLLLLPNQAQSYSRVISLKPNITEIVFALGSGRSLVGVSTYCTRPEAAKKLPRIADYIRAQPEKILRLKPDLVLASKENGSQKEVYFLKNRGIHVELFAFSTLEETYASIKKLGKILGKDREASHIVSKMQQQFTELSDMAKAMPTKKILFLVGQDPLVVAGGNNFLQDTSPYLGVHNTFQASRLKYPTISTEQLIRSEPEIIIDLSMGSENTAAKQKARQAWWQRFQSIPAVQNERIIDFAIEEFRAAPNLPIALKKLFYQIHQPDFAKKNKPSQ